jgi:hypothetical protein
MRWAFRQSIKIYLLINFTHTTHCEYNNQINFTKHKQDKHKIQ